MANFIDGPVGFAIAFAIGLSLSDPMDSSSMLSPSLPPLPKIWHAVLSHPHTEGFKAACAVEIATLEAKGLMVVVDYPANKYVIPVKWVFTYKIDENGYWLKDKA